ncbi:MAG: OmpA family protein [Bacteroidota bacterium]
MQGRVLILAASCLLFHSANAQQSELIWGDPVKLPPSINSEAEEALLVFSRDSSTLFFMRQFHAENIGGAEGDQDIWYTRKDATGQWEPAKNMKVLNNKDFNAVVGAALDGQTIYLYNAYVKKKNQLDRGIAVSKKKSETWQTPTKVDISNFKLEGDLFGFYVNPQETYIIISYKGKNSLGEEDLYVSKKQSDGSWGEPIHMGPTVNSSGYEMSPFLSEDGYSLFFSSNGFGGEGDADIFVSFRMDETWTNWSKPQNLGNKVNSPAFDAYFIMSKNEAYFASNRGGATNADIYNVKPVIPEVEEVVEVVPPPKDTTPVVTEPIKAQPVELKIYFALNSSYMEKEAIANVENAITQMKANPNMKADVSSHADIRADDHYNEWLTQRRANRVKDYMVLKGIDPSRINTYWHGKKDPAVKCSDCTEEEHRLSRRTIIKLY